MARPLEGLRDRIPRILRRGRLGRVCLPAGWNGQGERDQKRARLLRPLVPRGLEGRPLPSVRVARTSLRSRRAVGVAAGSTAMSRQLKIPAADTQLYAVDTPGGTPPLLFLSGGFGTVRNWNRVIRSLDGKYRTVG